MSVLIEAISVVVRVSTLEARYPGGVAAYEADCPNGTFCSDAHLTRVGFMTPVDVRAFVEALTSHFDLTFFTPNDGFVDAAVVDQRSGPTARCSWIEFEHGSEGPAKAWLDGATPADIAVPKGWSQAGHASLRVSPNEEAPDLLIERAGNMDQILDQDTGKVTYVGRPFGDLHTSEDLFQRARQHEAVGELVEASHLYEQSLRIRPDNANLWFNAGVLRGQVDGEAAAVRFYRKALELAPNLQPAACNLGTTLSSLGDLDEALMWLRRAVELQPGDPVARWSLATTLEQSGSPESTEAFLAFLAFLRVARVADDPFHDWAPMLCYAESRAQGPFLGTGEP